MCVCKFYRNMYSFHHNLIQYTYIRYSVQRKFTLEQSNDSFCRIRRKLLISEKLIPSLWRKKGDNERKQDQQGESEKKRA